MSADAVHHIGLRVASLEDAFAFYEAAFGARWLAKPFLRDGAKAERIMSGPAGVRFRVALIGVGRGVLELFEFESPRVAATRQHPSEVAIMHYGIEVDDVHATLERVLAAGGSRVWAETSTLGDRDVMYVADPDENVIELMNAPIEHALTLIHAANPGTNPDE